MSAMRIADPPGASFRQRTTTASHACFATHVSAYWARQPELVRYGIDRRGAPYAEQLVTAAKNPPMSKPTAISMAVATAPVARYGIGRRPASESLPDDQMTTSMAICTTTTMMSAVAAGGT